MLVKLGIKIKLLFSAFNLSAAGYNTAISFKTLIKFCLKFCFPCEVIGYPAPNCTCNDSQDISIRFLVWGSKPETPKFLIWENYTKMWLKFYPIYPSFSYFYLMFFIQVKLNKIFRNTNSFWYFS